MSRDQPARRLEPGQCSHQNAIIATTGRVNLDDGPRTRSDGSAPLKPTPRKIATGGTSNRLARPKPGWRASHFGYGGFWGAVLAALTRQATIWKGLELGVFLPCRRSIVD
jgi:hypothetical protein